MRKPAAARSSRVSDGHDRRKLADADLGAADRCGDAVDGGRENRLIERAVHDDAARGHANASAEIDRDDLADRAHVIVERAVLGAQVGDVDAWDFGDPLVLDARADHQARVALALVGEHVEKAPYVIAPDPGVRHVADELRRFGIAIHDLRPLMPRRRALSLKKEIEQLVRARALAELYLDADVAQLVRSVGVPRLHPHRSLPRFLEILVEGAIEQRARQSARFAARSHGDGRRRRIEIGQLHRPRDVVDSPAYNYGFDRLEQIRAEAVSHLRVLAGFGLAQLSGDERRVLEAT